MAWHGVHENQRSTPQETLKHDSKCPRFAAHARQEGPHESRGGFAHLREQGSPNYVTHDLDDSRDYTHERWGGGPDCGYGILASSNAQKLGLSGFDPASRQRSKFMAEAVSTRAAELERTMEDVTLSSVRDVPALLVEEAG